MSKCIDLKLKDTQFRRRVKTFGEAGSNVKEIVFEIKPDSYFQILFSTTFVQDVIIWSSLFGHWADQVTFTYCEFKIVLSATLSYKTDRFSWQSLNLSEWQVKHLLRISVRNFQIYNDKTTTINYHGAPVWFLRLMVISVHTLVPFLKHNYKVADDEVGPATDFPTSEMEIREAVLQIFGCFHYNDFCIVTTRWEHALATCCNTVRS